MDKILRKCTGVFGNLRKMLSIPPESFKDASAIFEVMKYVFELLFFNRRELEFLRSQQQRASEVRSAEEVERKKELEASHQQLELQKKYLEEIREEQELARQRAEEEIRQVHGEMLNAKTRVLVAFSTDALWACLPRAGGDCVTSPKSVCGGGEGFSSFVNFHKFLSPFPYSPGE